ncbi:glycosyltransferase [Profundibacterium mesophilum]|uniref:UDP-glucoseLPS alpha-13-glucosyltransferase n=1 Tax=Profundibacterium mesophilum KAUST100406-0324 TaxID=1037889 RepID=A0A921NPP0_9RHOB|nr:glycosyltransferase [Profundibacterium mesophilum]KAF0674597.1 UDP-glucoseLPS alpha-13-glucosyltransferase [Profundibacterium mesophilum KAUST100406-0324]
MRVLVYNWVDYRDDEKRGGGVTVYLRNLMETLGARGDVDATFLSSGVSYDPLRRAPRWEPIAHGPHEDRGMRYEIVNSGTLAPSHMSFGNPAQLTHPPTRDVFLDFVAATGPYDVIHFHNLEGLPADVLSLKREWPRTKILLSLHNYYPVCPQVNLWHREAENCVDFDAGHKCTVCLPVKPDERLVRAANGLAYMLKRRGLRPGTRAFDLGFRGAMGVGRRAVKAIGRMRLARNAPPRSGETPAAACRSAEEFAKRRAEMVTLINAHCDGILCVSDRVAEVAARYGIAPELLRTLYIGTRQADRFERTEPRGALPRADGTLHLGYLGYMRRDKGFFFLLDALEAMPAEMAARIRLTVAARGAAADVARLSRLAPRLAQLVHLDGYGHDNLDAILSDVDVGLVPVQWEDNLPQVAIEMHARHIPLLTSDLGGAQELGNTPSMVFRAGDAASFAARIAALLEGGIDIDAYWRNAMAPVGMEAHLQELLALYRAPDHRGDDVSRGAA